MTFSFKPSLLVGSLLLATTLHASDANPVTPTPPQPHQAGQEVSPRDFLKRYNQTNLPVGTLVRIEGSLSNHAVKNDQRSAPDAPLLPHFTADFVTILQIGHPNRIVYETDNFAVPWDVDPTRRHFNIKKIKVVGDGHTWTELLYGSSSTYKNRPFHAENEADIRPLKQKSWYVSQFLSGYAFFTPNLDEGYIFSANQPQVEKLEDGWRLAHTEDTIASSRSEARLRLNQSFAPISYTRVRLDGRDTYEIHFSDWKEFKWDTIRIQQPMPLSYTHTYENVVTSKGECRIHFIEILEDADPKEIFRTTIPKGWEIDDHVADKTYIQGQGPLRRMWNNLRD